jgi:hypothetical protein
LSVNPVNSSWLPLRKIGKKIKSTHIGIAANTAGSCYQGNMSIKTGRGVSIGIRIAENLQMMRKIIIIGGVLLILFSCKNNDRGDVNPVELQWDFEEDAEGWTGDFADYPVGEEESFELQFSYDTLPEPLDQTEGALKLSGSNLSDDLFMFLKKEVTGLQPNTSYNITFNVEFASDVPDGLAGIGGSPGESVYIKAGATRTEPEKIVDNDDYYRMNIDKSNQSSGGDDMLVIGDFSNDTDEDIYVLKTVSNGLPFNISTDSTGILWIIVGTDSGFEGKTTIYYNSIHAEMY